ncbi:MAG: potassium channel family protein [Oceanobacter sp.]
MKSVTRFISHHRHVRHAVYQTEASILRSLLRTAGMLLGFIALHVVVMVSVEGLSPWQAIWLTLTTLSTVGYGDLSATTPLGQLATMLLMFVCGVTLVTLLISDYVDYRIARRERIRTGYWDWNMADHILIINAPRYNREEYFIRLVKQIRDSGEYQDVPVMLLNEIFADGLPDSLRRMGVVHVTGSASRPEDLDRVGVDRALNIVVLAQDEYSSDSDSFTFDICYRLYDRHLGPRVIAEVVDDENRPRLKALDIKTLLRPIRSYPEIIVRAMVAPGVELIIEDMFTHANHHGVRYPIWLEGERWADVVNAVVQANLGTPLAYVAKDGEVFNHPDGDERIHAQSLIVLVHTEKTPSIRDIQRAVEIHFNKRLASVDQ